MVFSSYNGLGECAMKKEFSLILKGMLIGLGKVVPGVSGSLIAVSLGIYEKAIDAIGHFFQNLKENMLFLGTLGIGLIISIAFGSKLIIYLLEFSYVPTMLLFIGFIAGVFPSLSHKIEQKNKSLLFFFLIAVFFVVSLNFFSTNTNFYPENNLKSYIIILGIGFLDAATMVIPGISGTAIFMILGCYAFVLNLFGSLSSISGIVSNFSYFLFFALGLLIGVVLVSRFMNYCFQKYKDITYAFIMGFTLSSIFVLLEKVFVSSNSIWKILLGICFAIVGYHFSVKFGRD